MKHALGNAGPAIATSPRLTSYICEHRWLVIAETVPASNVETALRSLRQRDPRFELAEYGSGIVHPTAAGLIVGFFLTHHEATELAKEVVAKESDRDFAVRQWDFNPQPKCTP